MMWRIMRVRLQKEKEKKSLGGPPKLPSNTIKQQEMDHSKMHMWFFVYMKWIFLTIFLNLNGI